jgi:hypothetical protein
MLRLRDDAELVKLKECGNTAEAALARALLDANGIECVIGGEQIRAILGPIENSAVPLLVRAHELGRAREVLDGADAQPVDEAELTALAVADGGRMTEAPMQEGSDKPVDPQQAEREREERETMRFVSGAVSVLLGITWGMLKLTGTNAPVILVLGLVALGIWLYSMFRKG